MIADDYSIHVVPLYALNPAYPCRSADCSSDGKRARAAERKNLFSSVCSCVWHAGGAAMRLAPRLTRSLARRSPRSRFGEPISAGRPSPSGCGWMQRRVRRRIERLLRRATLKRNSDGESIWGMSGTDFHAIFSRERPSSQDSLGPTLIGGRGFFFRSPYPASARGIDQPGGRLHTFLSYRHCLTAMVVGSTGPPHHLTIQ